MLEDKFLTILTLHDSEIFVVWIVRIVVDVLVQWVSWEVVQVFEMVVYVLDYPLNREIVLVLNWRIRCPFEEMCL